MHESALFFGREKHIAGMLEILQREQFLAVVGSSGCGKSSLVRAGLLPALQNGYLGGADAEWRFVVMRPGSDPFGNLARAIITTAHSSEPLTHDEIQIDPSEVSYCDKELRRGPRSLIDVVDDFLPDENTHVFVLVDQFEEIFRFTHHDYEEDLIDKEPDSEGLNDANAFVDLLISTAVKKNIRIYVAITMRSDFVGNCDAFRDLPRFINRTQFLPPRMTREDLQEAIERPIQNALFHGIPGKHRVEPEVIARLLQAIGKRQDQLPLIQHALMRMWLVAADSDKGAPVHITTEVMAECCGQDGTRVAGALDLHATELYESLTEQQRWIAEHLFRCLADRGSKGQLTRRLTSVEEVARVAAVDPSEVIAVVEVFRRSGVNFLVPSPSGELTKDTDIDVSHESLLRQWGSLQGWIKEESEAANEYRRLIDALAMGDQVIVGNSLDVAVEWQVKYQPTVAWAMRYDGAPNEEECRLAECLHLIDNSVAARKAAAEAAEKKLQQEKEAQQRELERAQQLADAQAQRAEAESTLAETQVKKAATFRKMLVVVGLAAVLAVVLAVFALLAQGRAMHARDNANQLAEIADREKNRANELAASASISEAEATIARDEAQRLAAKAYLQQGHTTNRYEQDIKRSVLWYATAFKAIQEKGSEIRYSARSLIGGWSRSLPRHLFKHGEEITEIALSADGLNLATVSSDGIVRIWDVNSGDPRGEPLKIDSFITELSFNADGGTLATASYRGGVRLWNIATLKPEGDQLNVQDRTWREFTLSSDGAMLATGHADGTVRLWDVAAGKSYGESLEYTGVCGALSFSGDGTTIAVGSSDGTIWLWNVQTGESLGDPIENSGYIKQLSLSTDGSILASGTLDGTVRIWNRRTREPMGRPQSHVQIKDLSLSGDGGTLASGSGDGTVQLWDVNSGQPLGNPLKHDGEITGLSLSADGAVLATASQDGVAGLWDVSMRKRLGDDIKSDGVGSVLAFREEADTLAMGSNEGTVLLWDTNAGEVLDTPIPKRRGATRFRALAFSGDGSTFVTGNSDGTVLLWDVTTGQPIGDPLDQGVNIMELSLNADGKTLAIGKYDGTISVWDVSTAKSLGDTIDHGGRITKLTLNTDGNLLATGNRDGIVQFWDVATGRALDKNLNHGTPVSALSFSKDGATLATGSRDGTVLLWDVNSGDSLGIPIIHGVNVTQLSLNADGRLLVTGSNDGTVQFWDVSTGQALGEPLQHRAAVSSLTFSADGRMLAIGSYSGNARLWEVPEPVTDDPELVWLSVEVRTGLTIESGLIHTLSHAEWLEKREKLRGLGSDILTPNQAPLVRPLPAEEDTADPVQ
jgi:WD40 repeat protein